MNRLTFSAEQIEDMRNRYQNGETMESIGSLYGVSKTTVGEYCYGLERIPQKKLTNDDRAKLMRGWR